MAFSKQGLFPWFECAFYFKQERVFLWEITQKKTY